MAPSHSLVPEVHDALGLALAALDRPWLDKLDADLDRKRRGDGACHRALKCLEFPDLVELQVRADLDLDLHRVHRTALVEHDLIVGRDPRDAYQYLLDLARVDVDAPDDEHVVGPAGDPLHATERPPARALARDDAADVARPVSDDRDALLGERREHDLALLPIRHRLQRLRV